MEVLRKFTLKNHATLFNNHSKRKKRIFFSTILCRKCRNLLYFLYSKVPEMSKNDNSNP